MSSTMLVLDLEGHCTMYHVKAHGFTTEPVQLGIIDDPALPLPQDYFYAWFLWNLENDRTFRLHLRTLLKAKKQLTVIQITAPCLPVAKKSSEMSVAKAHEHVELLTMLSWFSTFGGAYSNLGDEFEKCAEMAGKISVTQMKLALRLGDKFLVSRCRLYYSIALIQRGFIRPAKQIVRKEYEFAKREQEADPKLLKMCLGIWSKLIYTKQLKCRAKAAPLEQLTAIQSH